jgi:phosphoglycolate phosphatase
VLFDLDGTLADTAPDMARALNLQLARHGRPALPLETIRPHVSHGARAMMRIGFALEAGDADYAALRQEYLDIYGDNLALETAPFPGVPQLLESLEARCVHWGVVTNKPAWLTEPLMSALGLAARAACIVSGDTAARPKPHPDPVLHACALIGVRPRECWTVGDARRDIAAGRAAGTGTLAALFGYLGEDDDPASWGADGMIRTPLEVLEWLAPAAVGKPRARRGAPAAGGAASREGGAQ